MKRYSAIERYFSLGRPTNMENLIKNVRTFLAAMEPYVMDKRIEGRALILIVKAEAIETSEKHLSFYRIVNTLTHNLKLDGYIRKQIFSHEIPGSPLKALDGLEYRLDLFRLYIDQLREQFSKPLEKDDVSEAISFLRSQGLTEREFQNELNISKMMVLNARL